MALRDLRARHEAQTAPSPAPSTSYIDEGCELSGKLRFRESVQIDGKVDGEIESDKTVIIGPAARVRADIKCESIVISGHVEGDIHARRQITFHKSAKVNGQMTANGIVVEEGSRFKGSISIGEDEPEPPKADPGPAQTKPLQVLVR